MKKNSIIYTLNLGIALLIFGNGCTPVQKDHFSIKVNIKGVAAGTAVLQRNDDETHTVKDIDSVVFKDGKFELKGKLNSPEMLNLLIKGGNWATAFFVENGHIQVDADTAGAERFDYREYGGIKGANLKVVKVSGSNSQQEFEAFENDPEKLKFKAAFAVMNKKVAEEKDPKVLEQVKAEFEALAKQSDVLTIKQINALVTKNPASSVAAFQFYSYYATHSDMRIEDMDAMMNKFTGAGKNSVYYLHLSKELDKRKAVTAGKQAPEFELLKRDSTTFKLSSLKGKYVMLDFWASWCKPCRAGIPEWKKVYATYQPKGLEIVSITNDTKREAWLAALDQEKMTWIQVADEFSSAYSTGRVITQYQAPFLPFFVLIDKEGKIILRSGDEKVIVQKLKEVLN